jgi:adenosine deaminase
MPVSVRADEPSRFGNSLADGYATLLHLHGSTRKEIRQLRDRTVRSAWLEPDERHELRRDSIADPAWPAA